MVMVLNTPDVDAENGLHNLKVLWISKFDVHKSNRLIAEKYVITCYYI